MTKTLEQVREKVYAVRTQIEAHRKGLHGSWDGWAQEIVHDLSIVITELDNLSAQAKVRVTDEDVDLAKQAAYDLGDASAITDRAMRSALESFAARLSQGVQGEAVACERCKDRGVVHDNVDVDDSGGSIGTIEPCPRCWSAIYDEHRGYGATHEQAAEVANSIIGNRPAEREAMSDGWVLVPRELNDAMRLKMQRRFYQDRSADEFYAELLTAAPQPPEGARVVDDWQPIESAPTDGTLHVRGLWVRTPRGSYFDAIVGGINDEGEFVDLNHDSTRWDASDYTHWHRLSAAPTLSGKEGAK